ncbi:hypothetical protein COO60DRAFT_576288 [Scenedesmus sp. NREL 46B-D3]|nr:hypothetical protein COO60DRAFT_576288 [Scenedesmus sp. NREL 46B-D3]
MPDFMASDVAPSSQVTYDAGVQRFQRYCHIAGRSMQPRSAAVAEFIACMVAANYKLSTIAVTMASLRRWARQVGQCGEELETQEVQQALKVARRLAVRDQQQKLPLSAEDLVAVLEALRGTYGSSRSSSSRFVAVRDAAMFVVGWAGLLRSSEIVGLDWEAVHFTSGGQVMLYLPKSKTDPGAGAWVFLGSGFEGSIRPAVLLRALQQLAGGDAAVGAVFTSFQTSRSRLSKNTVGPRLKKALVMAGVGKALVMAGVNCHCVITTSPFQPPSYEPSTSSQLHSYFLYCLPSSESWPGSSALIF